MIIPKIITRYYDKKDAPKNAEFLGEQIETNGVIDYKVKTCKVLAPNQRRVYIYEEVDFASLSII